MDRTTSWNAEEPAHGLVPREEGRERERRKREEEEKRKDLGLLFPLSLAELNSFF